MTADLRIRLVPSDELGAFISAFLDDLALANRSSGTTRFYRGNLGRFHWWCAEFGVPLDPESITTNDIRQFLLYVQTAENRWGRPDVHMANRTTTPSLLNVYFRSLRPFFNWLVEQEIIDRSPMDKLKAPRFRVEQPDPFTTDELKRIERVLRDAGDGRLADRDRAIVAMLLDVGLRASELGAIDVVDLNLTTGDLVVRSGKGDKARQLRIGARARRANRRYFIRHRRDGLITTGPFFLTRNGQALNHDSVKQLCDRIGAKADVHPSNAHRYRHTAAVNAVRAGMNLFQLQMMLGHTSLEMTRRYVKLVESDMSTSMQDHSPLDYLKLGL